MPIPSWKIPPGVSRGTWDYVHSKSIASDYDNFVEGHPLLALDIAFVRRQLPMLTDCCDGDILRIADFGCGTGRVSRAFSPEGHRLVNIDLSERMLAELMKRTRHPERNQCLHSNLAELDLPSESIDLGLCLFSSYGMIRGRKHRLNFLTAARKALTRQGKLILHAHNRFQRLWDPAGPAWLVRSWCQSWGRSAEFGDRVYAYRGLPAMFLHIFSKRELKFELAKAGFRSVELHAISGDGKRLIESRIDWLRAGGFFAVAQG